MASYTCYLCQEESSISSTNAIQLECCSNYVDNLAKSGKMAMVRITVDCAGGGSQIRKERPDPAREQGDLFSAIEGEKLYVQPYKNA